MEAVVDEATVGGGSPARPGTVRSPGRGRSATRVRRTRRRLAWMVCALVLLAAAAAASIALGSHTVPAARVWPALAGRGDAQDLAIVRDQRLPRTVLGILCGAALAVAGSLMQSLTRNPLAEPGILGINAGASVAVVLSVVVLGATGIHVYMLFALIGAAVAGAVVWTLGSERATGASVVRLALAGVAVSAALTAVNQALVSADQTAFDEFRFWVAGSLENRGFDVVLAILPLLLLGLALAAWAAPGIHALGLGTEAGIALGVDVRRTQILSLLAVALLAGGATAAMGPVTFVGLAVPFISRSLVGHDVRWATALSLLLGPVWVLAADVAARLVLAPQETQVGIVATLVGAPVFIALMSRRQVEAL